MKRLILASAFVFSVVANISCDALAQGQLPSGGNCRAGQTCTVGALTSTGAVSGSNLSGTNTGNVTLATIGATPSAEGASLSGQALTLQPASASFGGVVTNDTQSIAGSKTFTSAVITFEGTVTSTNAVNSAYVAQNNRPYCFDGATCNTKISFANSGTTLNFQSDGVIDMRLNGGAATTFEYGLTSAGTVTINSGGGFATPFVGLALVNGANDNVALGTVGVAYRITGPTAVFNISGIAGGTSGKRIRLYNTVAFALTLNNESASSTAANRITTLTGADLVTTTQGSFDLIYDATDSRWIVAAYNL